MSDTSLPEDNQPINLFEYWQESFEVWSGFAQKTSALLLQGVPAQARTAADPKSAHAETLTSEFLRTLADTNLQHWRNTARLLDSLPNWMQAPSNMTGSALVDWFDRMRRAGPTEDYVETQTSRASGSRRTQQPAGLPGPDGRADDLTRIKGIGPKLSSLLNELGIYHFRQIAGWGDSEAAWVDDYLAFKGRVKRENWVAQARSFSANGTAETLH